MKHLGRWVQLAVLARVPLLVLLILWALALLGGPRGPATVSNMMLMESLFQLAVVVFLTFLLAHLLGLSAALTWSQATARFGALSVRLPSKVRRSLALQALPFWLLALPLAWRVWQRNAFDQANSVLRSGSSAGAIFFFAVLGLVAAVALMVATEWLARRFVVGWLLPRLWEQGKQGARALGQWLGPGYIDPTTGKLEPGHGLAVTTAGSLALFYLFFYGWLDPAAGHQSRVPTLAYVLGLLMLIEVLLAGVAFFLDRYRFPLLISLVAYAALIGTFFPRDHFFYLRASPTPAPSPAVALEARRGLQQSFLGEGRKPVLTVVAASGGGIQSAAWTAQVLTGLQRDLGAEFSRSVYLISSVSGGSVGAFFYLYGIDGEVMAPQPATLRAIQKAAEASSLEATAWGLTFPDFQRAFLPGGVDPGRDRAWALERALLQAAAKIPGAAPSPEGSAREGAVQKGKAEGGGREGVWGEPGPWLSDWSRQVATGRLPAVIFNTTAVDTGNQTYFSTLDLAAIPRIAKDSRKRTPSLLYGGLSDVPAVSAARLSATFPYVTPVARARRLDGSWQGLSPTHFADGGYFDNFGVVAGLEWLLHVEAEGLLEDFDKVLFLQINAFPPACAANGQDPSALQGSAGWIYSTLGPVRTVLKVLTSSQVSRNELELALKGKILSGKLKFVTFRPPARCPKEPGQTGQEGSVAKDPPECQGLVRREPPVSWYLARSDRQAVRCDWLSPENRSNVEKLRPWFATGSGLF